jgi:hypothetical protein
MTASDLRGDLRKMSTELAEPIRYGLPVGGETIALNPLLGSRLSLEFTGRIHCIACGRETKKSFNQGYCFPCFRRLARCDSCIVRPEQCHYQLGTCREPEWGIANCMRPHVVYLANSSDVKVGITRETQVPTRWIDQGAVQALPIARVATRRQSGLMEVALKRHVSDRTNWRRMLKGEPEPVDLSARRDELLGKCAEALDSIVDEHDPEPLEIIDEPSLRTFHFPVLEYPERVSSLNLDKAPSAEGSLLGIKGQYLILDTGVLNVRKYGGYEIELEIRN